MLSSNSLFITQHHNPVFPDTGKKDRPTSQELNILLQAAVLHLFDCGFAFDRRVVGWHAFVGRSWTPRRAQADRNTEWRRGRDDESSTWRAFHAARTGSFYGTRRSWRRRLPRGLWRHWFDRWKVAVSVKVFQSIMLQFTSDMLLGISCLLSDTAAASAFLRATGCVPHQAHARRSKVWTLLRNSHFPFRSRNKMERIFILSANSKRRRNTVFKI